MQNSGSYSVPHFHNRLVRWGKLRTSTVPLLVLLEPISESMLQGIIISWLMDYYFGISAMAFFLLHLLVWFLFDYTLISIVQVRNLTCLYIALKVIQVDSKIKLTNMSNKTFSLSCHMFAWQQLVLSNS